ncbi:MAG: alanine--tRNA ligase [Gammaproteobacteria bacterium]|nr:alanine--tRNA ligase [Gammaproteobacteria bacterium]|tara:strand:- start:2638 stop:5247 length:2610 start_codon:yes stop_codon:yes gene_type:complete
MKTADVRAAYLKFFEERGHRVVPSSPLVPHNDPTLLFTNAGMNQFKDALLGREDLGFKRAASVQRCVRAGGKHNDLENVGYTARHHTLFEMLGNFSFGDYFKEETISWAWAFITEVLELPKERLWVTVHPTDDESRRLWEDRIGVPRERVIDLEENFWAMGDTGPCGPCTEIFYDHGPEVEGGPPGSADEDGDRYIEFWNLVFPQFDRQPDGELTPLPQPGVDTGMGLERITAILQGVHSNYQIDLFQRLLAAVGRLAGIDGADAQFANASVRVIADHIRSSAFLIADGVMPGNEDRSYVLRRIIRRALRHGYMLDIREPFFHKLVAPLAEEMGDAYPVLRQRQAEVEAALLREEQRFAETLNQGMELLDRTIDRLSTDRIPGDVVFQLYDTYGFPTDLTADVARERGLTIDMEGFEAAMEAQRERGRAAAQFSAALGQRVHTQGRVEFLGYDGVQDEGVVKDVFDMDGKPLKKLEKGERGLVILDRTPFYAESGGQIGDSGTIGADGVCFEVEDTQSSGDQHLHVGIVREGRLAPGDHVRAAVDAERRRRIMLNHSATHLMHAALRNVLGSHVQQKGSLVAPDRLRFDFSHPQPMTAEEIARVEAEVNEQIQANTPVGIEHLSYDDAMARGAMALFGEKYGDEVRVLSMGGDFSVELCGGTHVSRTGDIGVFRIVSEGGVAAGVRRIEAVTGPGALAWIDATDRIVETVGGMVRAGRSDVADKVAAVVEENRRLSKELERLKQKLATSQGTDLAGQAVDVEGIKVLAAPVEGDPKSLMQTLDMLKSKLGSAVIVLGNVSDGKVNLIAGVSKDLTDRVAAPDLISLVGPEVGAKGGGRPDMARAGGGDRPDALGPALAKVQSWVAERVG